MEKNRKKRIKDNRISIVSALFLSILVIFLGVFIMSKKEDMDFDEILTFGLANNTFQLDVEDYREYGGNELLLQYAAVKEGEEFNVKNVFFNQKMDTHPPLYYLIVNFISSIRKESFSMWHGLIINIFFMIALFWEMRYLFILVIEDKVLSTIFSLIAFFAYGFVNEIVFIRMYVMLSAISMAFVILIIKRVNTYDINRKEQSFYILFFILCVLGILTQYHFMIIAFYFSVFLGVFLICKKDYKSLLISFVTGLLSITSSVLIFPQMIKHLFGETSLHAINGNQIYSLRERMHEIALTLYRSFFGIGFIPYLIILLFAIILLGIRVNKRKINYKDIFASNGFYFVILVSCIFYYFVIAFTAKYTFARYLYNIYPLIMISLISAVYLLYKNLAPSLKYLSLAVLIMIVITSRLSAEPFSLNVGNNAFYEFLCNNSSTKILALYRSLDTDGKENTQKTSMWKLPRPLYTFRDIQSISFVDLSKNNEFFNKDSFLKDEALFLLIYTMEDDDQIIGKVMGNSDFANVNKVIDTTYYHMYRLSKKRP